MIRKEAYIPIFLPTTRGELLDGLKRGMRCYVTTSNVEITNILLDGWLEFEGKYKTYPSENIGWVIYEAKISKGK